MTKSARLGSRHALLALLFAGTALTGIAQAADTQTITGISKTYAPGVSIEIPTIEITDGELSKETVDALVAGDTKAWGSLATLTAGHVAIPEIIVHVEPPTPSNTAAKQAATITFRDLTLDAVNDGIAGEFSLGGVALEATGDAPTSADFGKLIAKDANFGLVLSRYGLTDRQYPDMVRVYSSIDFDGGHFTTQPGTCSIGSIRYGAVETRSNMVPYADYMAGFEKLSAGAAAGEVPDAESLTAVAHFFADDLRATLSEPEYVDGFNCDLTVPHSGSMTFSLAGIGLGRFADSVYPQITLDGIKVNVEGSKGGHVNLDNFTWKPMDLSGPIAQVLAQKTIDWDWLQANATKLIPAMDGFSFAGLDLDIPDAQTDGERVKLSLASFDASLSHYLDGIPADLDLSFDDLKVNLPQGQADGPAPELIARGITDILLDGEAKVRWDEAAGDLVIDSIAFDSPELGHVGLSATLGNASKDLFSPDETKVQAAAMALTLKTVSLSLEDRGIAGIIFSASAREAGQPEPAFRAMLSGMSQGMLMAALGNSDSAMSAAQAVGQFMQGKPKLDLTITAKDPAGMPVAAFAAASENPTILAGQLTVEAEASGEPLPPPPAPATPDAPATDDGNSVDLQMAPEAPAAPTQPGAPAPQPTAPGTGAGAGGIKSGIGLTLK